MRFASVGLLFYEAMQETVFMIELWLRQHKIYDKNMSNISSKGSKFAEICRFHYTIKEEFHVKKYFRCSFIKFSWETANWVALYVVFNITSWLISKKVFQMENFAHRSWNIYKYFFIFYYYQLY